MCELQRDEARGNRNVAPLRNFTIFIIRQILLQCNIHQKNNEFDRRDRIQARDRMCVDFFAENMKITGRLKTWM